MSFASPYAELYFLDIYFADLDEEHIDHALATVTTAERRFGI